MRKAFLLFTLFILLFFTGLFFWRPLLVLDYKNIAETIWLTDVEYKTAENTTYLESDLCSEDSSGDSSENPLQAQKECPCLFLLHGLGDRALTWKELFQAQARWTRPSQIIAVDLPGAGGSHQLDSLQDYQVDSLAKKYNKLSQKLCKSQEIHLVANSFGGWIASWMLYQNPQQYTSSLLLNPAGLDLTYDKALASFIEPSPQKIQTSFQLSHNYGTHKRSLPWFVARHASARFKRFPIEEMILAQDQKNLFIEPLLASFKDKVSLVWGLEDGFLGPKHLEGFKKILGPEKVKVTNKCAHIPQSQCPEVVEEAVLELLNHKSASFK